MLLPCPHGAVPQFEEINVESLGLHSLLLFRASLYPSESIKPNILALHDKKKKNHWRKVVFLHYYKVA